MISNPLSLLLTGINSIESAFQCTGLPDIATCTLFTAITGLECNQSFKNGVFFRSHFINTLV
jgi:hypothetical protein